MKRFLPKLLALSLFAAFSALPVSAAERAPVSIGEGSELPLRVLTRPFATLYSDNTGATAIESNVPAFRSYYVYDRPVGEALATRTGWYEVGRDDKGTVVGWMKGEDVFEWKQTMCLAFSHPEGRRQVLMFEDGDELSTMASKAEAERTTAADNLYAQIEAAAKGTPLNEDFPVLSIEPKMAVDITKSFYLLPILEHRDITIDGREGRMLRIAAVSGKGEKARESSDLRTNTAYLAEATADADTQVKKLADMKIDVVWVIDTTRSMGPYIEAVRGVMKQVADKVAANPALKEKIAFGAWGYRDPESIANIGYNTFNYTPALEPVDQFLTTMTKVEDTRTDSVDVEENLFAGMADAIEKTAWREGAMRFVVLVGDAPGHNAGHKWNTSGQDENTLRALASDKNIRVFGLHIMPNATKKYNKIAARQFKALSQNPGVEKTMYGRVKGKNMAAFDEQAAAIADVVVSFGDAVQKGEVSSLDDIVTAEAAPDAKPAKTGTISRADVANTVKAAAVTWLGSASSAEAPRDVEAWVLDKDLTDANKQALEVRILLNKRQLDSLATLLNEVLAAGRENQVSGDDFFTSLQAASAVVSRDPDMLAEAETLADSGLIPSFLAGLPYHSQLMDISNDLWASWGPDEQDAFLNHLEAKVKVYSSIHDAPELWVALNPDDDPADYVAPIQLDLMP